MKKLEQLSVDQEKLMNDIRQEWLDRFFSCKTELNKEACIKGINWMYQLAGYKNPIVIFVDSPLACQYAVGYLKNVFNSGVFDKVISTDQVRNQLWDQVRTKIRTKVKTQVRTKVKTQVRTKIRNQIRNQTKWQITTQIRDKLWDQVWNQVRDQVKWQTTGQVRGQVWNQVRDQIDAQIWNQVGDRVRGHIRDQGLKFEPFGYAGGCDWYGFAAWGEFYKKIGINITGLFEDYHSLIGAGHYDMIQLNGFCIVSKLPVSIHRNSNNMLHSVSDAAIEFSDAYKLYFIRGVAIPFAMWQKLQSQTFLFEDWVKEENEEVKSAALAFMEEKWGSEYLFRFISNHLKEVNTYTHKKDTQYLIGTTGGMNIGVYTLFEGEVNNINLAFIRCYCPSTDRMFFLCVGRDNKNAKDGIASLYRIPRKLQNEIKYIQRQGERFSTVLTDKGKDIVKQLSKEDLSDLVNISGEQYFSQLTYEY